MQGSTSATDKAAKSSTVEPRRAGGVITHVFLLMGAVTAVSFYTFWRVDRVQENVATVNQFYVPVLKHLNLLNGKWSAYQRAFEQGVGFRKWGAGSVADRAGLQTLRLRKMVELNLAELARRVEQARAKPALVPEAADLKAWTERLARLADSESATLAEIASLVKAKHYAEAATVYARARQEHLAITQGLGTLSRDVEGRLAMLQLSTEQELRSSQSVMLLLLAASLLFSLVVLFRLRRWLLPIVEWTRVAQEIALKGTHRDVRFPQITRTMPPEISLLTREFTRMGTTVLERERTIHQQKQKLELLNVHLKEQNEMLRKLGGLNERILNSMTSGLLVVGADGLVEQFNDRYCHLFGADRGELLRRPVQQVLAGWPPAYIEEWLTSSEPLYVARLKHLGRVFDVRVQQLHAGSGRILLFEDVGQIVEAEEKLEHAKKLVLAGDLSSQVAHEVRNPLNSMSLQLDMLKEDVEEGVADAGTRGGITVRIDTINEQVARLERITGKYLDVRRSVSVRPRQAAVDLHAQIEKCLAFLSGELQAAQVRIELLLSADEPIVSGDADALAQVLFNLVRNAIEALREKSGGRLLRVLTSADEASVRVCIEDNGPGLKPLVRERLFQPFVTDKASGHGLGLSVSRQICIEHGGELRFVDSGGGEPGAAFEFKIPRERTAHAPDTGC